MGMRIKVWMIVVAAVALCAIWVARFVANSRVNDLTVYDEGGGRITTWKVDSTQIVLLLVEIGATVLAALVVGLWTTRQAKRSESR
jgi:FtsZ-interacting cell division protein ZipA